MSPGETPRIALSASSTSVQEIASDYLLEYLDKIRLACKELGDERVWTRLSPRSNSIGNLMLHLKGNLSLWIAASLGGREFVRDRPAEFAADGGEGFTELYFALENVVEECRRIVQRLGDAELASRVEIQGYRVSGLAALLHAVEHMSYHTGQIVLLAKAMRDSGGEPLEFYPHLERR